VLAGIEMGAGGAWQNRRPKLPRHCTDDFIFDTLAEFWTGSCAVTPILHGDVA
jgi:hypothetical protein